MHKAGLCFKCSLPEKVGGVRFHGDHLFGLQCNNKWADEVWMFFLKEYHEQDPNHRCTFEEYLSKGFHLTDGMPQFLVRYLTVIEALLAAHDGDIFS